MCIKQSTLLTVRSIFVDATFVIKIMTVDSALVLRHAGNGSDVTATNNNWLVYMDKKLATTRYIIAKLSPSACHKFERRHLIVYLKRIAEEIFADDNH